MILLIGLQAAGKKTVYRQRLEDSYGHISMDLLRNNPQPARRQAQLIEQASQAGQLVVLDNPVAVIRAPLIVVGKRHGCAIIGYTVPPAVAASLQRNAGRVGTAKVPPVATDATRKQLQPPVYAEGSDALYSVHIVEDSAYQVQPWIEETRGG
jgi:hypothetical protein